MTAILIEHYAGLWPFWLSPRQVMIVPIKDPVNDYAFEVRDQIHAAGFFVDVDSSGKTMQKKVREAQMDKYNYILVLGEKEKADKTVNVRLRNNEVKGVMMVEDLLVRLKQEKADYQ